MSEIERINYSYRLNYSHRAAITVAEFKQNGWLGRFQMVGFYALVFVAILIEIFILRRYFTSIGAPVIFQKFAFLGAAATFAAIFIALSIYCFSQRLIADSRYRGVSMRHGSVSADGVVESRNSMKSQCGWPDIKAVERTAKVTLLLLGDGSAYVIPHDALTDGVTAETLHNRITKWRREAKEE